MSASKPTEECTSTSIPSSRFPLSIQGPELTGVNAVLQNENLWQKFADNGTEMIITKVGRRMFPTVQVTVSGLEPDTLYFVLMDMVLAMDGRLKFNAGKWERGGVDDGRHRSPGTTSCYLHPESPSTGAHWMARPVSMQRAKVTNCTMPQTTNTIAIMSMHLYQPRVHVVRASDFMALAWSPRATFAFPVTQFVAVTAYQNKRITAMKINHNPFAKGFRDKETLRGKRVHAKIESSLVDSDTESSHPPAKRSRPQLLQKQESTTTLYEDSGVSSIGSASPSVIEEVPALPWEYFAWAAARAATQLVHPFPEVVYHPYQLWNYPFLLPPLPPLFYSPYDYVPATPPFTTS